MMRLGWVPDFRGRTVIQLDDEASLEKLKSCVDAAIQAGRFAFDTETTGLDVLEGARMFLASFSWLDKEGRTCPVGGGKQIPISSCAVFIGTRHAEIKLKNQAKVLEQLTRLLTSNAECSMFNSKFDAKICWADNIPVENLVSDVMLDVYVLDPGFGDAIDEVRTARKEGRLGKDNPLARNLKDLAEVLLCWSPEERDEVKGWLSAKFGSYRKNWKYNYIPADLVSIYACADTERTLALSYWAEKVLREREQLEVARMETQLALVVAEMEVTGLPLNMRALEHTEREWLEKGRAAHDRLLELTGLTQLSVMSQDDLAHYAWPALQKRDGGKTLRKVIRKEMRVTDGGKSVAVDVESYENFAVPENWDIDALSSYAIRSRGNTKIVPVEGTGIFGEFCAEVLTKRMADKIVGTYLKPWRETWAYTDDEGVKRLHPTLQQDGADTGRFSCKDPQLQNVPLDARVAGFEDYDYYTGLQGATGGVVGCKRSLVYIDYSQIEYRVFAHYAGGEVLERYQKDPSTDFHQALADMLQIKRSPAKTLNFGILYGMGKDALIKALMLIGFTAQGALDAYEFYHQKFPQAKALYYEAQRRAKERGWVKNLFGGRRYLQQKYAHVAFNTIIQGTAALIVKRAMLRCSKRLRELAVDPRFECPPRMLLQIHDELVFETPAGTERLLADEMNVQMIDEPRLNCPLITEASVCFAGEVWKNKHKLEKNHAA